MQNTVLLPFEIKFAQRGSATGAMTGLLLGYDNGTLSPLLAIGKYEICIIQASHSLPINVTNLKLLCKNMNRNKVNVLRDGIVM